MLNDLKKQLDEIETVDEKAYSFIQSTLIQKEEKPDKQLTKNQFSYLIDLHNKYTR